MATEDLGSFVEEIVNSQKESAELRSKTNKKLTELARKIKNGGTTGDIIRDFVIVNYGTISEDIEKPFRGMQRSLEDKEGSSVLVCMKEEVEIMHVMFPYGQKIPTRTITELQLGVLSSGLEFGIKDGTIILPTDKHAIMEDIADKRKWTLEDGPITISRYSLARPFVKDPISFFGSIDGRPLGKNLSAILIDKEVDAYIHNERLEVSYVIALNLLGKKAPKEFNEYYDSVIHSQKVSIIQNLKRHIAERLSSGENCSKDKYDRAIKGCVEEALKLGMHQDEKEVLEITSGISVNIREYIFDVCKNNGIEIPK